MLQLPIHPASKKDFKNKIRSFETKKIKRNLCLIWWKNDTPQAAISHDCVKECIIVNFTYN